MKKTIKLSKFERFIIYKLPKIIKSFACEVYRIGKILISSMVIMRKGIRNIIYSKKNGTYDCMDIMKIIENKLNPRQFEIFICELLKAKGHKAVLTPKGNDYGRDIVVNNDVFIECKHYSKNNLVGREICQKLLGSAQMLGAKKCIIVTTGKYHKNAYEVRNMVNNLNFWDSNNILEMLLDIPSDKVNRIIVKTLNSAV